jgi:hypothetical protein
MSTGWSDFSNIINIHLLNRCIKSRKMENDEDEAQNLPPILMAADDFFDPHQLDLIGAFHLFQVSSALGVFRRCFQPRPAVNIMIIFFLRGRLLRNFWHF